MQSTSASHVAATPVQSLVDAPHVHKDVLAAMLHGAARLSAVEGVHRLVGGHVAIGEGFGDVGFYAAQGASAHGFQRCLQWPRQWFADGQAHCAVRCCACIGFAEHLPSACVTSCLLASFSTRLSAGEGVAGAGVGGALSYA